MRRVERWVFFEVRFIVFGGKVGMEVGCGVVDGGRVVFVGFVVL